jgi:hypothetical protein
MERNLSLVSGALGCALPAEPQMRELGGFQILIWRPRKQRLEMVSGSQGPRTVSIPVSSTTLSSYVQVSPEL